MRRLHILNGDATKHPFEKSGIEGEVTVWPEILVEGPLEGDIQSESFWDKRKDYVEATFGGNYAQKVIPRLELLHDLQGYDEVILWFEYDLFCQANMLGCLAFIEHHNLSLVCLGDELGGTLQGLGQIQPEDYAILLDKRLPLSAEDLAYASAVWQAWQTQSPEELKPYFGDHATFKYLGRALQEAHLLFPQETGLNALQLEMQQMIHDGTEDERKIVGTMLRKQTWLGFGDLQYFKMLERLG